MTISLCKLGWEIFFNTVSYSYDRLMLQDNLVNLFTGKEQAFYMDYFYQEGLLGVMEYLANDLKDSHLALLEFYACRGSIE